MTTKNLAYLRESVGLLVNFNPDEPDQDFAGTVGAPWKAIDYAINQAYETEVQRGMQEVSTMFVRRTYSFTWTGTDVTITLPAALKDKKIYALYDETSTSPGNLLWVQGAQGSRQPTLFFRDRLTLQWGTTGPGEDKTIVAFYLEEPVTLVNPTDEPELIPPRHRDLIAWTAAIMIRQIRDDMAPGSWTNQQEAYRMNWWQDLMSGQPAYPAHYAIIDPYLGNEQ